MAWEISRICSGKCVQVVATLTGCLTALSDGMQGGWSSPIIPRLLLPSSPVKIGEEHVLWLENVLLIGGLFGSALTVYLVDKIGRKKTMLVAALQSLLAWTLMIFAKTPLVLLLGRLAAGLSGDINYITTPIYIAEISHKNIRGRLESTTFVMMHAGILLVYLIGPFIPVVYTSVTGAAVILIQMITFSAMPESPYYLLMKKKEKDAEKCLKVLRASSDVEDELVAMRNSVREENATPTRFLDIFLVKSNRKALLVSVVLNGMLELSGSTVIVMNFQTFWKETSSTAVSPFIISIAYALLLLISTMTGTYLMDAVGRRKLMILSCFSTSLLLFVIASYFRVKLAGFDLEHYSWISVVAIILYAITLKNGLGLVPSVITAELFPTNVKAYGCAAADVSYILGSTLSIFLYDFCIHNFGFDTPFYFYGVCTAFAGVFSVFVVPETKGKTLFEIQKMLKGEQE